MRKKNIARAGAAFVLLLALTGVTIFGQDTETTSRAETPRTVSYTHLDVYKRQR